MNSKKLLASFCLFLGFLGAAPAVQADDDITLGRTILLGDNDNGAKIPLIMCRRVDAIQVRADRDLYLKKVEVTFKNGDTKKINFYRSLREDERTDWRKFAYKRCVKKIEVFGRSKNSSAGVRVYGRK
ncbi:DUF2541 family protein [Vibrio sinensis]|uniref:DUF2541 family protein n=1 Tax=Vibrio sinensis TaxID=2302434 RepID=A0A3A6RF58_9VIBR|nr:DUF2541 family protein [Vibrio sinensis]RJX75792.1 DUF2541 family protein [Vibrio sinensis]